MLMLDRQFDAALDQLTQALDFAQKMGSDLLEFHARIAQSYCYLELGQEDRGLDALRLALAIGRRHHYMNCHPWWLPKVMARLCARALDAGIEIDYVQHLIKKRGLLPECPEVEAWPWPLKVYTLGRFALVKDGEPIRALGRVQNKVLDLLRVVIALGGRGITSEAVIDALWPEAEGDAGRSVFDTTLHRLRKLLGNEQALNLGGGKVAINEKVCWVDLWAFERLSNQAQSLAREGSSADLGTLRWLSQRLLGL
jgi:hypothetical protein